MSIKISIITICFNSEKTIEKTISSIINQDYDNFEYIIIDGGSTDGTLDIIRKYKQYISVLISESDKGISDAFNKGIINSTGDLIGLINSDDLLTEGSLKILASEYSQDIDIYLGNLIIWNEKTNFKCIDIPTMKFPLIPLSLHICHPSTFITKNAYLRFGMYRVEFKTMMDLDLLIRYYKKNAKFKHINRELAIFKLGGISQISERKKLEERKNVLLMNGGTMIDVILFQSYLTLRYFIKKVIGLFGEDIRFLFIGKKMTN